MKKHAINNRGFKSEKIEWSINHLDSRYSDVPRILCSPRNIRDIEDLLFEFIKYVKY